MHKLEFDTKLHDNWYMATVRQHILDNDKDGVRRIAQEALAEYDAHIVFDGDNEQYVQFNSDEKFAWFALKFSEPVHNVA
jgi:hypothetical protein